MWWNKPSREVLIAQIDFMRKRNKALEEENLKLSLTNDGKLTRIEVALNGLQASLSDLHGKLSEKPKPTIPSRESAAKLAARLGVPISQLSEVDLEALGIDRTAYPELRRQ